MLGDIQNSAERMASAAIPDIAPINARLNSYGGKDAAPLDMASVINIQPAPIYLDDRLVGEIMFNQIDNKFVTNTQTTLYMKGDRK
ncbi:hypothetical protein D1872_251250 [compost metagenome]